MYEVWITAWGESVNSESIVLSGGLYDYLPDGFAIHPYEKEALSWEGVGFFPASHHWEQADVLLMYRSFFY